MNLSVLKSPGAWITLITSLLALLVNQGVILSGSTVDTVISYVLALAGALVGHIVTGSATALATAATAPQNATVTK